MTQKLAYLAGPIQGCESKQDYRKHLAEVLEKSGFKCLDPWKRESILYSSEEVALSREEMAGFIQRDLEDVSRCDLFVAYIPQLSAGTCMELFHAKNLGKKTLVISELTDPSPWIIYHSDIIVNSIDEIANILSKEDYD